MNSKVAQALLLPSLFVFCTSVFAQKLYWTASGVDAVSRANLDGSNQEPLLLNALDDVEGIAVDSATNTIFWVNGSSMPVIRFAGTDGSNHALVYSSPDTFVITDLVFEPDSRTLFFVASTQPPYRRSIMRVNSDGSNSHSVADPSNGCYEVSLAVDSFNEKLYWAESCGTYYQILVSNFDGSDMHTVVDHIPSPENFDDIEIAVDGVHGNIFWLNTSSGQIWRSQLDGQNSAFVLHAGVHSAVDIAVNPQTGSIYYCNDDGAIRRAEFDGSSVEEIAPEVWGFYDIRCMTLDSVNERLYWAVDDVNNHAIDRCRIDGSNLGRVYENQIPYPRSISLAENTGDMFIQSGSLYRVQLDGRELHSLPDFEEPIVDFAIDQQQGYVFSLLWRPGSTSAEPQEFLMVRTDLNGEARDTLIENPILVPLDVIVDSQSGGLIWTDGHGIRRSGPEGTSYLVTFQSWVTTVSIVVDSLHGKLYWTEGESPAALHPKMVRRSNLDGSNVEILANGSGGHGIAVDPQRDRVYWSSGNGILMANLNGSNSGVFVSSPQTAGVEGVAVEPDTGAVYWASTVPPFEGIWRAQSDGTGIEGVLTDVGLRPQDLAIDSSHRRIYFVDRGLEGQEGYPRVARCNLDGANHEKVVDHGMFTPWGITVNSANGLIYWADSGAGTIMQANAETGLVQTVLERYITAPHAMTIDTVDQKVYWTEGGPAYHTFPPKIRRISYDGSSIETVLNEGLTAPSAIAVDPVEGNLFWFDNVDERDESIIMTARRDGTAVRELVQDTGIDASSYDVSLVFDPIARQIYWTSDGAIRRAGVDGAGVEDVVEGVWGVRGLAINNSPHVVSASVAHGSIDARQPHDMNDSAVRFGWSEIELEFSGSITAETPLDLELHELGDDGVPPYVVAVSNKDERVVYVALDRPIDPGAWTCFYHVNSGMKTCLGYLPGDVSGDGASSPVDVLSLIDSLNGVANPPASVWQTDINRSGETNPEDVLRLIDLLNGAGPFDVWNGRTLAAHP